MEVTAVERAAASYLAPRLATRGVVAFDEHVAGRAAADVARSPGEISALATAIRARKTGPKSAFYVCAGPAPSSCSIRGADVFVSLGEPRISGGSAFIMVRTMRPSTLKRVPVLREEEQLELVRRRGVWTVSARRASSIS
jgi:hypothetical protein